MCWLIFNFLPLLRNQIELLIIGKCLSCTFSRALDTCFFSHPSWDWCFGKQRFTFSVDESFCEKHGSMEVCSAAQCLLSLCLHVDDKLIALRPGHSSFELCLLLSSHLFAHKGAECHQEGAPIQVADEKHFWISEPLLIFMNEALCVGGLFSPINRVVTP